MCIRDRVKAYAFKEKPVGNSPFRAVNPDEIVELKEVKYEAMDTYDSDNFVPGVGNTGNLMRLLRVYGEGGGLEGYDRVMVLLEYETQEMDYFNEDALPFLKALMKKYHDNDINLTALYSDEMHIQQDWFYFSHHENGQFAERYLTESMACLLYTSYRQHAGPPVGHDLRVRAVSRPDEQIWRYLRGGFDLEHDHAVLLGSFRGDVLQYGVERDVLQRADRQFRCV